MKNLLRAITKRSKVISNEDRPLVLKGATASTAVYSVVETCKANGINPFKYLVYLFERMPNINFKIHPEKLDELLPWNEEVKNNCK